MNIGPHAVAFGMMSTASKRVESAWPMYVQGDRVAAIEYGTWTPILGNESVDEIPLTYTAQRGYYCRVGNLLHVSISINAAGAVTSYGDTRVYIRGLSFEPVYTESTGMISISGLASSYTSKAPGALGPYADYIVIMGNDMNSLRWNQFSDANKKLFYGAATYIVKW